MPCGQYAYGRLVQMCTSRTSPIVPDWMYSFTSRASSVEWPWLPICVTILGLSAAFFARARHSSTDHASGFCTYTCLPRLIAAVAIIACV